MQKSTCKTSPQLNSDSMGLVLWEEVRENARGQSNRTKIVVGPATYIVMRPRSKSNDKTKTLAAFTAHHLASAKANEEQKAPLIVPHFIQSAAANQAANAGAENSSSSSDAFTVDS